GLSWRISEFEVARRLSRGRRRLILMNLLEAPDRDSPVFLPGRQHPAAGKCDYGRKAAVLRQPLGPRGPRHERLHRLALRPDGVSALGSRCHCYILTRTELHFGLPLLRQVNLALAPPCRYSLPVPNRDAASIHRTRLQLPGPDPLLHRR